MKSLLIITSVLISLMIFSLSMELPSYAGEEEEILILIETAQTPEDYMKIAEYYEKQAAKMDELAQYHKLMGENFKRRSKPWPTMVRNCQQLTEKYQKAAAEYRAMAKEVQKKAQELQQQ